MAKLAPYLYSHNAREQAAFYAAALGGEIARVQTYGEMPGTPDAMKDRILHLELQALGLKVFMADAGVTPAERGSGMDLALVFQDEAEAARIFENLSEGGEVIMPFERMRWGTMLGRMKDAYGVTWQIATERE
ncbi:VOC family protein [Paenibacillus whitsoniae]|uniref:VOC family protein n=1 Tax=Paenibacillus whitsoniae TaxID=2496558 RepID=A0A3S0ANT4_9BACL|nr:VOC family protein [Paenibacillus whitsoniae]RTE08701.1 VOC family protein [Paenibacillus whitsoniae]